MKNYFAKIKHNFSSLIRARIANIVRNELIIEKYKIYSETCTTIGITEKQTLDEPIIISLTTYSKRVYDVYLVIESLFQQTIQVNKIILWLDQEEFNNDILPIQLKRLKERGLEIQYCPNYKSYKKIIPTLQYYPNTTIITVDDDIIYPVDFIENLLREYKNDKQCIYYYRGRIMQKGKKLFKPYFSWPFVNSNEKLFWVLPTGIGGVLYPKGCFDKRVTNSELFSKLCPKADDVWLRVMTMLNGYKCKKINIPGKFEESFISIERNQDIALTHINYYNSLNDTQIQAVFNEFKILNSETNIK